MVWRSLKGESTTKLNCKIDEEQTDESPDLEPPSHYEVNDFNVIDQVRKKRKASFHTHAFFNISSERKRESLVWLFVALIGIILSTVIIFRLISKYFRYEIVTEVSWQVTSRNNFPSITFCENDLMIGNYFTYCGVPPGYSHGNTDIACEHVSKNQTKEKKKSTPQSKWSNGVFDIHSCYTWDGKRCLSDDYFQSVIRLNDSCFTWNWAGNLYDTYGHAYIEFTVNNTDQKERTFILGEVHDPDIHEISMLKSFRIEPLKLAELRIRKTIVKRLPTPYPSQCVTNMPHHIFPGRHTRKTCMDSVYYMEMFKKCGDVLDYHKLHMPEDLLKQYKRNRTIDEVMQCIIQFASQNVIDISIEKCPLACEQMNFYATSSLYASRKRKFSHNQTYAVGIQYQDLGEYKLIEESPKYLPEHLIGEIGGVVALFIGASFVTLIEILISLTKRFC